MTKKRLHKTHGLIMIISIIIASVSNAAAQDIDAGALIRKHIITCADIAFSASELIPQFHHENKSDTIHSLLQFWQDRCGIPEPMMRYNILRQVQNRAFNDDQLPDKLPDYLADYKDAATTDEENYANFFFDFDAWEYHELHPGFNDFTYSLASSMKELPDLSPVERYFINFYSHDFEAAKELLSGGFLEGTHLDSVLHSEVTRQQVEIFEGVELGEGDHPGKEVQLVSEAQETRSQKGFHAGFSFGTWMPTGNLNRLGTHPQLGFIAGGNSRKALFGIHLKVGFLHTPHPYQAKIGGEIYDTQNFLQLYAGAHAGIDLLNNPLHALYITGGIGYDGIDPRNHHEREDEIPGMIHALNLNTGLRYQRILEETKFLTIIIRYNLVGYRNKGGTDLSGNVVTIGVGYGMYYKH